MNKPRKPTAEMKPAYLVDRAYSVQTPDGIDHPQGAVLDASSVADFDADLLAYYVAQGYLTPVQYPAE